MLSNETGADAGVDAGVEVDAGTDAGTADAGPALPGVPVLTSVTVVTHGTMALTWQLPGSGCATIGVRMKVGTGGAWATVKTLTGVATSTQYSPGHANGTYCYQVTCTLQGTTSDPSNEKCATQ